MEKGSTALLPLYYFFERLRNNEFTLGIAEYKIFLKAMGLRLGLTMETYEIMVKALQSYPPEKRPELYPRNEILSLCRTIWLKPDQSAQLFEEIFDATWQLDFGQAAKSEASRSARQQRAPSAEKVKDPEQTAVQKGDNNNESIRQQVMEDEPGLVSEEDVAFQSSLAVRIAFSEYKPDNDLSLEQEVETEKSKFLFTQYYYPIDRRKVQQNLRAFPTFRESRQMGEVDVEATIQRTIEKGYFDEILFQKVKKNTTHLLLLIDHLGSMIAFEQLAEQIRDEIKNALGPGTTVDDTTLVTYYFYNIPSKFLYKDKIHTQGESIDKALGYLKSRPAGILIYSDAGAARSRHNKKRIEATKQFLNSLHAYAGKISWLNPVPRERWEGTSAEAIAEHAAMFEATENGIRNAVGFLKGSSSKTIKMV